MSSQRAHGGSVEAWHSRNPLGARGSCVGQEHEQYGMGVAITPDGNGLTFYLRGISKYLAIMQLTAPINYSL